MNTSRQVTDTKPWYKQFWPWFLISLPSSVVIASIITISLAVKNAPVITQNNLGKFVQPINSEKNEP
tara:strand:- start:11289 stop:11489 length:201 start_codon:yes stop_codon:yes gene_type:complete